VTTPQEPQRESERLAPQELLATQEHLAPQEPESKARPMAFTVVSYNIRIDADKYPDDWESRSVEVYSNTLLRKPSIICLQENTDKTTAFFGVQLPQYQMVSAARSPTSSESVPIWFDTRIWQSESGGTMLMTERGPLRCKQPACSGSTRFGGVTCKHPRIFTWAVLLAQGNRILVVNTHFPLEKVLQKACMTQLLRWLGNPALPKTQVVCGDFNSHTPHAINQTQRAGFSCGLDFSTQSTFGTFRFVDPDTPRLDYILFRGSLRLQDSGISDYTYGPNSKRPSDHSLVYSSFIVHAPPEKVPHKDSWTQ